MNPAKNTFWGSYPLDVFVALLSFKDFCSGNVSAGIWTPVMLQRVNVSKPLASDVTVEADSEEVLFGEADLGEEYEEAVKGESEPGETVVFKRGWFSRETWDAGYLRKKLGDMKFWMISEIYHHVFGSKTGTQPALKIESLWFLLDLKG